jgi:glycosyltransferase involved in cell wall biosynthesis
MRVALITRSTLFTARGGDTIQLLETNKHLNESGIRTEIILADKKPDYNQYDLLHFFNITRPADILRHIERSSTPYVLSPIWIDYTEYDKFHRKGWTAPFFKFFPGNNNEYLKIIARGLAGKDIFPGISYLRKGQQKSIIAILKNCSALLTGSEEEYQVIKKKFGPVQLQINVPLGIDPLRFKPSETIPKEKDLVICVARIEGIKNQLTLIKALNNSNYRLLLIGAAAPNQSSYYQACKKIAAGNISFIDHLPQEELLQYYQKAKVHVLPGWYENCGLASLEAAAMKCNIVSTMNGFTSSYLAEDAFYCDPASLSSIYAAVDKAAKKETTSVLSEKIRCSYTWQKTANQTAEAYKSILHTK